MIQAKLYNRGPHAVAFRGVVDIHDDGSVRWHGERNLVQWQHGDFMEMTQEQAAHAKRAGGASLSFAIDDRVSWTRRGMTKTGFVVDIVPAGIIPTGFAGLKVEAGSRDHVSYVVKVGKKHYWPVVAELIPGAP